MEARILFDLTMLTGASAIVAVAAFVHGTVGFGMALIAAPLLLLVDVSFVPGPVLVVAFCMALLTALRERGSIDIKRVRWLFAGLLPGSALGALVVVRLDVAGLAVALSLVVLLAVLVTTLAPGIVPNRKNLVLAGVASGVTGTIASIGGPPVALLLQHEEGRELRGTLSGFFVCATGLSLISLASVGRFGMDELRMGILLIPGCLLGFALSGPMRALVDGGWTRVLVLVLSSLSALAALLRN